MREMLLIWESLLFSLDCLLLDQFFHFFPIAIMVGALELPNGQGMYSFFFPQQ